MRISLQLRSDYPNFPGGDFVAADKLKDELNRLGVDCSINTDYRADLSGFDLVQIYNTTRAHEPLLFLRNAHRQNIPCVLVPTWHSVAEMSRFYGQQYKIPAFPMSLYLGIKEWYYGLRSRVYPGIIGAVNHSRAVRKIVSEVDMVVANSNAELEILKNELGVTPRSSRVIYNAVDFERIPKKNESVRKDIFCIGRIEPRKNQIQVIRAFKSLNISNHKLCFVGAFNSGHKSYAEKFRSMLEPGKIEYLGAVTQGELFNLLVEAKVLVSASYFETTALVGLEALACGVNVAISDSPYSREYYREFVDYLDPYSVESIAGAILRSLTREFEPCEDHLKKFCWQKVVQDFLRVYTEMGIR